MPACDYFKQGRKPQKIELSEERRHFLRGSRVLFTRSNPNDGQLYSVMTDAKLYVDRFLKRARRYDTEAKASQKQ